MWEGIFHSSGVTSVLNCGLHFVEEGEVQDSGRAVRLRGRVLEKEDCSEKVFEANLWIDEWTWREMGGEE